jgi:hypothetical protein
MQTCGLYPALKVKRSVTTVDISNDVGSFLNTLKTETYTLITTTAVDKEGRGIEDMYVNDSEVNAHQVVLQLLQARKFRH